MTGGRLKRVQPYVGEEDFCFTYGDGVSDINLTELVAYHRQQDRIATLTAVRPPARFGGLHIRDAIIKSFQEKPEGDGRWINGGFFVLSPKVFDYLKDDKTIWEREPLEKLAREGQLCAYKHTGFWYAMDTLRDKVHLEQLWQSGQAPWKVWDDSPR